MYDISAAVPVCKNYVTSRPSCPYVMSRLLCPFVAIMCDVSAAVPVCNNVWCLGRCTLVHVLFVARGRLDANGAGLARYAGKPGCGLCKLLLVWRVTHLDKPGPRLFPRPVRPTFQPLPLSLPFSFPAPLSFHPPLLQTSLTTYLSFSFLPLVPSRHHMQAQWLCMGAENSVI